MPVELSAKVQLQEMIRGLDQVRQQAERTSQALEQMGRQAEDGMADGIQNTNKTLSRSAEMFRRVGRRLKDDLRALVSVGALGEGLKLSSQFRDSIRESVSLSDSIRKLGGTFGVAGKDFVRFQSDLIRGLGQIGLSSEVAGRTLEGLADTPVRGQANVLAYAQSSGQLASVGREQGREGEIARGIAKVIQARGGNANDLGQMRAVSEDLRRVFLQTGKGPTETLKAMEDLFTAMPKDLRSKISTRGLANMAAAGQVAGPNSTLFLQEMLGQGAIGRQRFEAQGFGGVFGEGGIDIEKFAKASQGVLGRIGNDPRMAAQTLGISEEAAEGFVRLSESLQQVKRAQDGIARSSGNLESTYRQNMGLTEAFRANINKVKGLFAEPISGATQGLSGMLGGASESTAGSIATVAGGGLLAALLTGGGLRGIGKSLGGTALRGAAAGAITGEGVQPVYVVNAAEIGGGGMLGGLLGGGGAGGMARLLPVLKGAGIVAGGVGLAAAGAYAVHKGGNAAIDKFNETDFSQKLYDAIDRLLGFGKYNTAAGQKQRVIVETKGRDLQISKQPTRGGSFGP